MRSKKKATKYINYFIHVNDAHYDTFGPCGEDAHYSNNGREPAVSICFQDWGGGGWESDHWENFYVYLLTLEDFINISNKSTKNTNTVIYNSQEKKET